MQTKQNVQDAGFGRLGRHEASAAVEKAKEAASTVASAVATA